MKKTLIIAASAILCAASHVQGVSFAWTAAGLSFGSSLDGESITASIVYLGNAGSLDASYLLSGFAPSAVGTVGATTSHTYADKGGIGGNFEFTNPSLGYSAGDVFGLVVSYVDATGTTWYNLSTVTYSVLANAWESPPVGPGTQKFGAGMSSTLNDKDSTHIVAGGGWYAVPEPATAALAVAGLALLFKRRRK